MLRGSAASRRSPRRGTATHRRNTAIGAEPSGLGSERITIEIGREVGLDGVEAAVTQADRRPVVRERRRQGTIIETQACEPTLMLVRPVRAAAPHDRVPQQEMRQPVAGLGLILDHVATQPAQVTHRLLGR